MENSNAAETTKEINIQRDEYILNDERFGNEPCLVHADNDEQLLQDMPCLVDWANEHYSSLAPDDTTTREECLAGKIADTWATLNAAVAVPNHPELVACYEGGKYQIYRRHEGCDTLTYVETRESLQSKVEARLIGETSAGMTAVEIYEDDELVYGIDFFENGATHEWYEKAMRLAYDTMMDAVDWRGWRDDAEALDENGEPRPQDTASTTFVAWSWTPEGGWKFHQRDGQTSDWVDRNRDRLPTDQLAEFDAAE